MENKELETWLAETKAKNLSKEDLKHCIILLDNEFYIKLRKELKVSGTLYEHLFNQWQKEAEFSPKRGDRLLVWNNNEELAKVAYYFDKNEFIIVFVDEIEYTNYKNGNVFVLNQFAKMKPLPTENQKETDFKSKVIELIESEQQKALQLRNDVIYSKNYLDAHAYSFKSSIYKELLEQIKQLC